MEIEYSSAKVKKYFTNFNLMQKDKGVVLARAAKKRLDQLEAAENFGIYLTTGLGKPHPLYEDLKGMYGISLTGSIRLIVKPKIESLDPVSLKKCKEIIVVGVVNYHGQKKEWIIS